MSLFISLLFLISITLPHSSSANDNEELRTFIIHVSELSKPTPFTSYHDWYSSTLQSLPQSQHKKPKILYTYTHSTSGFSARLTQSQASHLVTLPEIISVLHERIHHLHTTHTPMFLGLGDNFGLWPHSEYGDDVIVGILDSGIWPESQSFNDTGLTPVPEKWKGKCETGPDFPAGSCNKKIIGATAFYQGYGEVVEGGESRSPRDTHGHGTHVASTAAGSVVNNAGFFEYAAGEAKGMAIRARISVYKICWSSGCHDSDILAAMDQAVADGVDVISLSVAKTQGPAPHYDQDSIAIGAFRAMENGILVVCAAGNLGPGPYTAMNVAPWILTVGASTIDRQFPADVILGDGRVFSGVSLYSGEQLENADNELVYSGDCGSRLCYEAQLDQSKVKGKLVVCEFGGNTRARKENAVRIAGGIGMILANTAGSGEQLIPAAYLYPATEVGRAEADKILEYVRLNESPTGTIKFRRTVVGSSPSAPKVAVFSSRGPNHLTPELLKPDVIAPGVNILAGWTGAIGPTDSEIDHRRVTFNIISGTSMSCPHVSGLAALLRKSFPNWSPAAIKSALMTTAYNLDNSGKIISDLATGGDSTPFDRGAGHVDPNGALNPGLVYDIEVKDYVAFLCASGYNSKRISVFVKEKVVCESYSLASPGDLNYPSFSVQFRNDTVTYKRVIKNVGSSVNAVYKATVYGPSSIEINVSPSELVFSEATQSLSYQITFSILDNQVVDSSKPEFGAIEWRDGVHVVRSPIAFRFSPSNKSGAGGLTSAACMIAITSGGLLLYLLKIVM